MKLAILFGSSSNEHDVSVVSCASIIKNLNKEKYQITPIYLDKDNNFYLWMEEINNILPKTIGEVPTNIKRLNNPFEFLKTFDLVFLMIHGKNGEDGTISAILDFLNIKYVGNKVAASVVTFDKILTKEILESNNIKTSPYIYFTKYNNEYIFKGEVLSYEEIKEQINKLNYPLFVKPANSGSSIGITKVNNKDSLDDALNIALNTDNRVLIESTVKGREVECAVLEHNNEVLTSIIGEVVSAEEFYSFSAKYTNKESITLIPAKIKEEESLKIQDLAKRIFKTLNCHGYSRIDFFITDNNEILLNEINTIPGFTEISMYPKLFIESGISYSNLLDILIEESLKK